MRRLILAGVCLLTLAGCGSSGLTNLAKTQVQYLTALQRAMPAVAEAQDAALRGVLARAQVAEEQALAGEQEEVISGVIEDAIRDAHLDVDRPTRDAVHGALDRLIKYRRDQIALIEAARAAREIRAKALTDAVSQLNRALPALVSHERTIADYLEAERGQIPLAGVSITQPPQDVRELIGNLNVIGATLQEQFARAQEIYDAAKRAAVESEKP